MMSFRTAAVVGVAVTLVSAQSIAAQRGTGGLRSGGPPPTVASNAATTDPMTGPLVTGAPFSADSSTVVTQTLGDGTRIEQRVTAKFYRDTTGRVRREQTIIGLDALTPAEPARTMITFDSVPGDPMPYALDPVARTVRRMPRGSFGAGGAGAVTIQLDGLTFRGRGAGTPADAGAAGAAAAASAARLEAAKKTLEDLERRLNPEHPDVARARQVVAQEEANMNMPRELERAVNQLALNLNQVAPRQGQGAAPIPADVRATEEQLGTRQIEGVRAIGRRTTAVIPINRVGNDQPITITDERWESPELRLVVYSRFSDPRTGVVEYRLTGINRTEPRADLFTVPADYTVIGTPGLRTGGPAQGGGRGRGAAPQ